MLFCLVPFHSALILCIFPIVVSYLHISNIFILCLPLGLFPSILPLSNNILLQSFMSLTHSEQRPQNIYSKEEIYLYFIIKLATEISLFSLQISKTWTFCVDKIKYEHLTILSNLKSCQFAPRIVIFNLCVCCQFEDLQIISPKIIPMSHGNI